MTRVLVRVTLAAPSGTDAEALHAESMRLMIQLLAMRQAAGIRNPRTSSDGDEGIVTAEGIVRADSAAEAVTYLSAVVATLSGYRMVAVGHEVLPPPPPVTWRRYRRRRG